MSRDSRLPDNVKQSLLRAGVGKAFLYSKLSDYGTVGEGIRANWADSQCRDQAKAGRAIAIVGNDYGSYELAVTSARAAHMRGLGVKIVGTSVFLQGCYEGWDSIETWLTCPLLTLTGFTDTQEAPHESIHFARAASVLEERMDNSMPIMTHHYAANGSVKQLVSEATNRGWWRAPILNRVMSLNEVYSYDECR